MNNHDHIFSVFGLQENAVKKYFNTRDKRCALFESEKPITEFFLTLTERGQVVVGGRSTCGKNTDRSWTVFKSWNECVSKINKTKANIKIEVIPQKVDNRYAGCNGGFWYENHYILQS